MKVTNQADLSQLTSLAAGGVAETLIEIEPSDDVAAIVADHPGRLWLLGHGTNSLVSDSGLPGTTLRFHAGAQPTLDGTTVIAEAGTLWDNLVQFCLASNLWGLEFTSGVPGSVGAAVVINITAYGQRVSETLAWAEVLDPATGKVSRMTPAELNFSYKSSALHAPDNHKIVLRAAFNLSSQPTKELEYTSALNVASEMKLTPDTLASRRAIILEARRRAGSLYDEHDPAREHTAGSFFKNPLVSLEQARELAGYEEKAISSQRVAEQNRVHGGEARRVSSAHVLLAAGYQRGQSWGAVRLHPQHVLKLENTGGATAQQIYDVAHEIMSEVKAKLDITLEPEVRFLGKF